MAFVKMITVFAQTYTQKIDKDSTRERNLRIDYIIALFIANFERMNCSLPNAALHLQKRIYNGQIEWDFGSNAFRNHHFTAALRPTNSMRTFICSITKNQLSFSAARAFRQRTKVNYVGQMVKALNKMTLAGDEKEIYRFHLIWL